MKKIIFLLMLSILFVITLNFNGNVAQAKTITYHGVKLENREVGILELKKSTSYYIWSSKKKKYQKAIKKQAAKKIAITKVQGKKYYYEVKVKGKVEKRYLKFNKLNMTYKPLPFNILLQLFSPFKLPALGEQVDYLPVQVKNNYTFGSIVYYGDNTVNKQLGEYLPSNIEHVLIIDTINPLKKGDEITGYSILSKSKRLNNTPNLYNAFRIEGKIQNKKGYRNTVYLDKNYKVKSIQITKVPLDFSRIPTVSKNVEVFPLNTSFVESEITPDPAYQDEENQQILNPVIPDKYNNNDYNYALYSFKGSKIDISNLIETMPLSLHNFSEEGEMIFYVKEGYTSLLLILDQNNRVVAYGYYKPNN